MIKPIKDLFLVEADEEANSRTESGLFIDTTWDKYKHAVQVGVVASTPHRVSSKFKYDIPINTGDKVYFHHFVVQPDNYLLHEGRKLYKADYFNIYCKIDNEPIMMEDWLFASAIKENEEDITKTYGSLKLYTKATTGIKAQLAKVEFLSNMCKSAGITKGDVIVYKPDADYTLMVEGTEYYRIKLPNVAAIIRNDTIFPVRNEVLVESNIVEERITSLGIILPAIKPTKEQISRVISVGVVGDSDYKEGDTVFYLNGFGTKIEHNGKKYIILRQEECLGLISSQ